MIFRPGQIRQLITQGLYIDYEINIILANKNDHSRQEIKLYGCRQNNMSTEKGRISLSFKRVEACQKNMLMKPCID